MWLQAVPTVARPSEITLNLLVLRHKRHGAGVGAVDHALGFLVHHLRGVVAVLLVREPAVVLLGERQLSDLSREQVNERKNEVP